MMLSNVANRIDCPQGATTARVIETITCDQYMSDVYIETLLHTLYDRKPYQSVRVIRLDPTRRAMDVEVIVNLAPPGWRGA